MIRHSLSIIAIGVFCLTVGAQNPTDLQKRAELFGKNKAVITQIVEKTVEASHTSDNHLKRADSYYGVLFQFNEEIKAALKEKDQARAKELSGHLATILDKGLKPTLEKANDQLGRGKGSDAEEFGRIKGELLRQFDMLLITLPEDDDTQKSLSTVRARLLKVGQ